MKKESSGAGATLMKTNGSGIGAVSFLRRLLTPEIIHAVAGHIDGPEQTFNG